MMSRLRDILRRSGAIALTFVAIALAGCSDDVLPVEVEADEALVDEALCEAPELDTCFRETSSTSPGAVAAAASMSAIRGSWNNWHVHDLPYGSEPYTDAEGLRHEDYNIWPVIWPDYPSDESPVVYCIDGAEKVLVGGDVWRGSKLAAGTCRNELYIIQIQLNASDAPAPGGWTALPLGNGFTFYYRLTPR